MSRFAGFAAIDWSGAAGERLAGLAVAWCDAAGGPPRLVDPERRWSRAEVLRWLAQEMPAGTLVGLDIGLALPFADAGGYFPGWADSPADARALWRLVDTLCAGEPHLGAGRFVDHPVASRWFRRHGGREGAAFHLAGAETRQGRLRVTERAQAERLGCKPTSMFNLVGAAQVGRASLTAMRVLHRLEGRVPVWPVDPLPGHGSAIVEIYTAIAAIAAGRPPARPKIRSLAGLDEALAAIGSPRMAEAGPIDDHRADALLTAAWLRANAGRADLWSPAGLTPALARTEGWTFGVP